MTRGEYHSTISLLLINDRDHVRMLEGKWKIDIHTQGMGGLLFFFLLIHSAFILTYFALLLYYIINHFRLGKAYGYVMKYFFNISRVACLAPVTL